MSTVDEGDWKIIPEDNREEWSSYNARLVKKKR